MNQEIIKQLLEDNLNLIKRNYNALSLNKLRQLLTTAEKNSILSEYNTLKNETKSDINEIDQEWFKEKSVTLLINRLMEREKYKF